MPDPAPSPVKRTHRLRRAWKRFVAAFIVMAHTAGAVTSIKAVMDTRTSQGAIAWAVSLNTMPYVAVPAYWIFGRDKFNGYVVARRSDLRETDRVASQLAEDLLSPDLRPGFLTESSSPLERLATLPFTRHNDAELLIDGEATFASIKQALRSAQDYILFQFYIVKDDTLGREIRDILVERAEGGVDVYFLYDEIGSHKLTKSYTDSLTRAGVQVSKFHTTQGSTNRFQINFRNHRKIVVVDGDVAFVGGHNVGDEYLGKDPKSSPWRDTHVRVMGPVVQCIQIPFAEDWHWATNHLLKDLDWSPDPSPGGDVDAICIPSGPADPFETCSLFFLDSISRAQSRLWIASPYFVPDEQIVSALQLAALRGVDVRILIPEKPDSKLVYLSAFSYLEDMEKAGIKIFRHSPGFLHQKVILIDDDLAGVGTANFDNRSFRLNFEITLLVRDSDFASRVEAMLLDDFSSSTAAASTDLTSRSFPFRLAVRIARLLAPIQ